MEDVVRVLPSVLFNHAITPIVSMSAGREIIENNRGIYEIH